MGELKKNKFKKKACIRLLLKNLSAPISLTRLHSQRARQLAWYAFNSLGTSAGLGSNEKKKKKQQNKYTNENLYEKVRELSETIHTQNTKPRKIYTGERKEKKKKNHTENCFLLNEKETTCVLFWDQTPWNLTPQNPPSL